MQSKTFTIGITSWVGGSPTRDAVCNRVSTFVGASNGSYTGNSLLRQIRYSEEAVLSIPHAG